MYWSVQTTMRPLPHAATHPPSLPLESEASEVALRPFISQASSIVLPTSSHVSPPFRKNGDSGRSICLPEHIPLLAVFLPVQGDPWHERTGTQLASGPMQICISPNELSRTDTVQSQGGQGAGPLGGVVLAILDLVL